MWNALVLILFSFHSVARAETYTLFVDGKPVEDFLQILDRLAPGDVVRLSDGTSFKLGPKLGSGSTTTIFDIGDGKALRLPGSRFSIDEYVRTAVEMTTKMSKRLARVQAKSITVETGQGNLDLYYLGTRVFQENDFPFAPRTYARHPATGPAEALVVERIPEIEFNLDDVSTGNARWKKFLREASPSEMQEVYWKAKETLRELFGYAIVDMKPQNLVYSKNRGWILVDQSGVWPRWSGFAREWMPALLAAFKKIPPPAGEHPTHGSPFSLWIGLPGDPDAIALPHGFAKWGEMGIRDEQPARLRTLVRKGALPPGAGKNALIKILAEAIAGDPPTLGTTSVDATAFFLRELSRQKSVFDAVRLPNRILDHLHEEGRHSFIESLDSLSHHPPDNEFLLRIKKTTAIEFIKSLVVFKKKATADEAKRLRGVFSELAGANDSTRTLYLAEERVLFAMKKNKFHQLEKYLDPETILSLERGLVFENPDGFHRTSEIQALKAVFCRIAQQANSRP